jgi:1,4-alpha-glucan branching enzyme
MGTELAPEGEWNHDVGLDWHGGDQPLRKAFGDFVTDLGQMYRHEPCLWQRDSDPGGFQWIDCEDRISSIISFVRWDDAQHLIVVLNLTPVPRENYRIGAPIHGRYVERFCSDDERYGGSQFDSPKEVFTEPVAYHGQTQSLVLQLPPLCVLVLKPAT